MDTNHQLTGIDSNELAERINEALEPTMNEVAERVGHAVAQQMSGAGSDSTGGTDDQSRETPESSQQAAPDTSRQPAEREARDGRESAGSDESQAGLTDADSGSAAGDASDQESFLGKAFHSVLSSFGGSLREEGGEQLESIADTVVDKLFSTRARGWVRDFADRTLQATLYDSLDSIDDPQERYQLYRESLTTLRPIVREAVDAMYTEENKHELRRGLRGAIPSIVHGDFETAVTMIFSALSDITDDAESAIWDNSREVLEVLQSISTTMLQESIQDAAEDKIDPEAIRERVQSKVEEARGRLQETIGKLQEGAQGAQSQLQQRTGGGERRGGQGMPPSGTPPSGVPPNGFPPAGGHPTGAPPSGQPPHGFPPSGVPPAVARQRQSNGSPRR